MRHRGIEAASATRRSDALPTELHPHLAHTPKPRFRSRLPHRINILWEWSTGGGGSGPKFPLKQFQLGQLFKKKQQQSQPTKQPETKNKNRRPKNLTSTEVAVGVIQNNGRLEHPGRNSWLRKIRSAALAKKKACLGLTLAQFVQGVSWVNTRPVRTRRVLG